MDRTIFAMSNKDHVIICLMKQFFIIVALFLSISAHAQDYGPHEPECFDKVSKSIGECVQWEFDGGRGEWRSHPSNHYNYYKRHDYTSAKVDLGLTLNRDFDRRGQNVWGYDVIDIVSFMNGEERIWGIRYTIGDFYYKVDRFERQAYPVYSTHDEIYYVKEEDIIALANLKNGEGIVVYPYGTDPYSENEDGFIQHYRRYGTYYPNEKIPGRCEWTITEQDGKTVARFTIPYEIKAQQDYVLEYGPYYEIDYKKFRKFQNSLIKILDK